MPQNTYARNGHTLHLTVPDPVPDYVTAHKWPADVTKALKAADEAWAKMTNAEIEWRQARDELVHNAPATDKQLLVDAIKAGKSDPGTPTTATATRAEEVAWVAFTIARDEAVPLARAARQAVAGELDDQRAALAKHELDLLDKADKAQTAAEKAAREAKATTQAVGRAFAETHAFALGSFDGSHLMLLSQKASDRELVRARLEALRDGKDDPTTSTGRGFDAWD